MNALFLKAGFSLSLSSELRRQSPTVSIFLKYLLVLDPTVRPEYLHTDSLIFPCATPRDGAGSGMCSKHGLFLTKETRTL
jgi:hypothetical protein